MKLQMLDFFFSQVQAKVLKIHSKIIYQRDIVFFKEFNTIKRIKKNSI